MKTVYMCFSTDILHFGHIAIIRRAAALGQLTIGVLTDEVIATYKRYPLIPLNERIGLFESLCGVHKVVVQSTLSYKTVLQTLKPDIVVHGDDWRTGVQSGIRAEVVALLATYGGELVELPYTHSATEEVLSSLDGKLNMPEVRRGRLRRLLSIKPCLSVLEAHNGLTGLIVENTRVEAEGGFKSFDAMWVSSLCDSTAKGKPDIELVDVTSRVNTLEEIMEVTTKPIILDGDTGGLTEHFIFNLRTLERLGISAIIIEDKTGLKKNSLFGTAAQQQQASVEDFCEKIRAGKRAQKTGDFMIFARCESLILNQGMQDALNRCRAYVSAGVDGIMIHSCQKTPDEIFEFLRLFRAADATTPIVVVPTTYNTATESELAAAGANIVIHANHLLRSAFPAMVKTAETILQNGRTKEADQYCMPIKQILTLIPSED
ncbi:MAG: phosphoenolpyruvate mutase [Clostridia bacterium]